MFFVSFCFVFSLNGVGLLSLYESKHMEIFLSLLRGEKKIHIRFSNFIFGSLSRKRFDTAGRPSARAPGVWGERLSAPGPVYSA